MKYALPLIGLLLVLVACAPQQQPMPAVQPDEVLEPQVPDQAMPVPGEDVSDTEVVPDVEAAPERHAGPSKVVDVEIKGFRFNPATIAINAGDSVRWTNQDSAPHDAAGDGWSTRTPMRKGEADEVRFDTPGTYEYICSIHPNMKGTVVVE